MSVCIWQNLEKYRVLWTDFSASSREINWFSVSKTGPEPAKPKISLALCQTYVLKSFILCFVGHSKIIKNSSARHNEGFYLRG